MKTLFLGLCLCLILFSRIIHKTWINPFTVLAAPYVFVVVGNSIYGENIGFYEISNKSLVVIGIGLFCFFLGTLAIASPYSTKYSNFMHDDGSLLLENYNVSAMFKYSIFVIIICALKAVRIFVTQGITGLVREGALIAGIAGHLVFSIYCLQPLLLLYWINHKKEIKYLVCVLLTTLVLFTSFVKYHVLCFLVLNYLFIILTKKEIIKRATLLFLGFAVIIFVGNYVVGFISNNVLSLVSDRFYVTHLWKYTAGAVINSSSYLNGQIGGNSSIPYKIMSYFFALPRMFEVGLGLKPSFVYDGLQNALVGNMGETTNVIDAISYMFPNDNSAIEIVLFILYHLAFGLLVELIFTVGLSKTNRLHITIASILTFFLFFSFFGTFYVFEMPWEVCIYSVVVVGLFHKNAKYIFVVSGSDEQ